MRENASKDLTTDKVQEDRFQNLIEQHNSLLMNSKARSVVKLKKKKLTNVAQQDDVNELNETISNSGVDDDGSDGNDNNTSKPGVGVCADDSTLNSGVGMESTTDEADMNRVGVPQELGSDFGGCPHTGAMEPY